MTNPSGEGGPDRPPRRCLWEGSSSPSLKPCTCGPGQRNEGEGTGTETSTSLEWETCPGKVVVLRAVVT